MKARTYALIGEAAVVGAVVMAVWAMLEAAHRAVHPRTRIVVVIGKAAEDDAAA